MKGTKAFALLLCLPLSACLFPVYSSELLGFAVNSSRSSVNTLGCNQGLQASILVDNRLSAESTQLPEGGFWNTNLGRFSTAESIPIIVEAYCYRENQPVGFIKVEGNVAVDKFPSADVGVSPPSVAYPEQPCYSNENNEYRIIESAAPIPCIVANWQPYE